MFFFANYTFYTIFLVIQKKTYILCISSLKPFNETILCLKNDSEKIHIGK